MMIAGLLITMKFATVLICVMNWVHLCSSLSDECREWVQHDEQDPSLMPFEIVCDILPNGTLNIKWTVRDNRVDTVTLDYNCTGFGEVQARLHSWIDVSQRRIIMDQVNLEPNSTSDSFFPNPTCYVDGCYGWHAIGFPTITIPTVTCNFTTALQTITRSATASAGVIRMSIFAPTTIDSVPPTPQPVAGGLKSYNTWFVVLLVAALPTIVLVLLVIIWRIKRRQQRRWWLHSSNSYEDKELLCGNEPRIDPFDRVKNDYFETVTILDPLELTEEVQSGLRMKNSTPIENHVVYDFNQQVGDFVDCSLSESSDSGNEDGSTPVRSASRQGETENNHLSACTQTVENGVHTGALESDSEKEKPLTRNDGGSINGASECGRPTSLNLRKQCLASTTSKELSHPNQIQVSVEVALPQESIKVAESPRSPQSKICSDCSHRNASCKTNLVLSPVHNGLSMHGACTLVKPTTLDHQKRCPLSCIREVAHSNHIRAPVEVASPEQFTGRSREHSGLSMQGVLESVKSNNINLEDIIHAKQATRNCLLPASACNSANQRDSQNTNFNAVVEQVCKTTHSKVQHLRSKWCDLCRHQHAQALCSSKSTPLHTLAEEAESFLIDKQQSHLGKQHLYHDSSPSHISFSGCTSRVYSAAQETNNRIGYLADLESHEGAEYEPYVVGRCRSECESAQDHDEGTMDQIKNGIIEIASSPHRHDNSHSSHQVFSEDMDDFNILYCAVVPTIQLPDSPCSGYVDTLPIEINGTKHQEDEETFGLGDEVVPLPAELTDSPHGGYISSKP